VHLDGLTSTVSWTKGDSFVTVQDTSPSGTTTTRVPIGHRATSRAIQVNGEQEFGEPVIRR